MSWEDSGELDVDVNAIQADLDNATDGLGALKALIDANQIDLNTTITDVGTVDTAVGAIQTDLSNDTDGLGALKDLIDANQSDLNTVITDVGTVDTAVGAIQTDLSNDTDGLGALKTLIDANQIDLTRPEIVEDNFGANNDYWTEFDALGRITFNYANERIEIAGMGRAENTYVYKATGANVYDFLIDFEFKVLASADNIALFGVGFSDSVGVMSTGNGLYAAVYCSGSNNIYVKMQHMTNGGVIESSSVMNLTDDTIYYVRFIRRGSRCWLGVYTDQSRETHCTGSPVTYNDSTPVAFTYLYPVISRNDGVADKYMNAYVNNIKFISDPDAPLARIDTTVNNIETKVTKPEIIANIFDIDMGYWTEVDAPGRVTIDYVNERIAITDLDNDEDVYVYKATDANVEDFILDFEFQVLNTATVGSYFGVGLADGIGTMEDVNNGLYVRVYMGGANNVMCTPSHMTNGVEDSVALIMGLNVDTVYYVRLIRRGSYCWLGVYSDRIRETHVANSPTEYRDESPVAFTHLYPLSGWDDGMTGEEMDAYVERIKLISAPDIDKYLGRHVE